MARIVLPRITVVGIDIQDRHIAAVASLRQLERGAQIASGIEEVPEAAIDDGRIIIVEPVAKAIHTLVQSIPISRLKNEPVLVVSLPPHHIYTETALFPLMNERDLQEAVNLRLETSLPWPKAEIYVDWKRINIGDPKRIAVFVSAVHKPLFDQYLDIFIKGKWRVAAAEFHLISLARLIKVTTADPFIFILIDEDGAEFAIFYQGTMISHYLEKIAGRPIQQVLSSQTKRLTSYAAGELGLKIGNVFLFDKIGIENQVTNLEKEVEVPVQFFSPPAGLDSRLFIAAGASQRRFGTPEEAINLIPIGSGGRYQENLILRTLGLWTNILLIFASILIVSFLGVFVFLNGQSQILFQENAALSNSLDRQFSQSRELIKNAERFNKLVATMSKGVSLKSNIASKLEVINREIKNSGVEFRQARKLDASGPLILTVFAPTRSQALDFKARLEATKEFSSIQIPVTELVPENNLIFNASIAF